MRGDPPQHPDGSPDLSQVEGVARAFARNLNGYKLIVEKSTVPVLTARRLHRTILRYANHQPITNNQSPEIDVASNPEFMREGSALRDCLDPDRIVLGVDTERARSLLLTLYRPWVERGLRPERLVVVDVATAELIKHAANAFLAMKISYVNFVADLCEATGMSHHPRPKTRPMTSKTSVPASPARAALCHWIRMEPPPFYRSLPSMMTGVPAGRL